MTSSERILQAFRQALVDTLEIDPGKVIPANDHGPRPMLPYITVNVTVPGAVVGTDADVLGVDDNGSPIVRTVGARRASVSVQGFGREAGQWLEDFVLGLWRAKAAAAWNALGMAVHPIGQPSDMSRLVDTRIEARWLVEFEVQYRLASKPDVLIEAERVGIHQEFGDVVVDGEVSL